MEINFDGNKLFISNIEVEFKHKVRSILQIDDSIIVLLEIPNKDNTINNIYAVSKQGEIIWQAEDISKLFPAERNMPYEQIFFSSSENKLIASDFYARRYIIDPSNGAIIGRSITK